MARLFCYFALVDLVDLVWIYFSFKRRNWILLPLSTLTSTPTTNRRVYPVALEVYSYKLCVFTVNQKLAQLRTRRPRSYKITHLRSWLKRQTV
jgi:hypothetical protein